MRNYREDLCLLPNAIDFSAYSFKLRERPKPRCIWLRSFHQIYNPSLALEVVAILSKDFPDIQLIMLGPDKYDGSLKKTKRIAAELGVTDQIAFLGGVSKAEVPKWLNKGDIFINTTNIDNNPISVIEAMASGLCIVSTDVGGIPYLAENEKDALLVPPNDPIAMAKAVKRLLNDPNLSEKLSMNAHLKVRQLDWSVILSRWEDLLKNVAERNHN
jgi:glycosyltransferase involved in cell wall biosynthesis